MNEPFFVEVTGVRVELVSQADDETKSESDTGEDKSGTVMLRLVVEDAQKLKQKHKNDDAVEFDFDVSKDIPVDVAKEMVCMHVVCFRNVLLARQVWNCNVEIPLEMPRLIVFVPSKKIDSQ